MSVVYCEICGSEIKDEVYYIKVDSSELRVCKSCARHGEVVKRVNKRQITDSIASSPASHPLHPPSPERATVRSAAKMYEQILQAIEAEEEELPEDFGRRVKEARERKGWKQAELAQKIHEKHSIIRKIEAGEIIPSKELREKLKRVLNIA